MVPDSGEAAEPRGSVELLELVEAAADQLANVIGRVTRSTTPERQRWVSAPPSSSAEITLSVAAFTSRGPETSPQAPSNVMRFCGKHLTMRPKSLELASPIRYKT